MSIEDAKIRCKSGRNLKKLNIVNGNFLNDMKVFEADPAIAKLLKEAGVPINSLKLHEVQGN
jgi:hypothetical protein